MSLFARACRERLSCLPGGILSREYARAAAQLPVILKEDVQNLGSAGKHVRVPQGYAHNWLLPKKLAIYDLKANFGGRKPRHQKKEEGQDIDELRKEGSQNVSRSEMIEQRELQEMLQRILHQPIVLKRRFRRGEILEGQVTRDAIVDAVAKQTKVQIVPELLEMDKPILVHGTFDIPLGITLQDGKQAKLEVIVRLPK